MNNEIKEILDFKENADYKRLSCDEIAILKDYITNLQEINNNLKEDFKRHIDRINELKQRIEKTVEYIEKNRKVYKLGVNQEIDEFDYISTNPQDIIDILNGRSDE